MRTLHMLHPLEVRVGEITSTVRNGFKWADLKPFERIELCVCTIDPGGETQTHDVQGIGSVQYCWFGRFKDIPAKLISNEHEVRSRTYVGLLASMRHAYGESFLEDNPVTVVVYERMS